MLFFSLSSLLLLAQSLVALPVEEQPPMRPGDIIPGKFIVRINPNARGFSSSPHRRIFAIDRRVNILDKIHINNFFAYVVEGDEEARDRLSRQPGVTIYPNRVVMAFGTQYNAPWGLARISSRNSTNDKIYNFPDSAGRNVDVYVVDTGVKVDHPDFEGRASWGASFVENNATIDGAGHGTHVAGTIASKTFGVAKQANIVAVRVLDSLGRGSTISVTSGMQWVIQNARKNRDRAAVINMSLGGGVDAVLDEVAKEVVAAGIHLVAAAGNSNKDACTFSPARVPQVLTVGAIDWNDKRAKFSNYGSCVDIFAPGVAILSTWHTKPTNAIDGTSMAAPHVAGIVALVLAERPSTSVADTFNYIKTISSINRLHGIRGGFNGIAFNNPILGIESNPPPKPAPIVCNVFQCMFNVDCDVCRGLF